MPSLGHLSLLQHDDERRLGSSASASTASTPFADWTSAKDALVYMLAFLIVLLAAHPLGVLFPRYLRLPLITGYLLVGIVAGPFVTELLPTHLVKMLAPSVNALALSFISFQAGQEIYLPELRPQIKGILKLLAVLYATTMLLVTSVLILLNRPFFFDSFATSCQLAIALMFGSIAVLGSPATVMAIKIELNSVGPFTSLMLGATMTAEFVVLVSFSISRLVSTVHCARLHLSVGNLIFTMAIVLGNLVVGAALALVIVAIFAIPGGPGHDLESAELLVHQDSVSHQGQHTTTAVGYLKRSNSGVGSGLRSRRLTSSRRDLELQSISESEQPPAYHLQGDDNAPHPLDHLPHPHNAYVQDFDDEDEEDFNGKNKVAPWRRVLCQPLACLGSLYGKGFLWLLMGFAFYIGTTYISESTVAAYGHVWEVKFEPLLVLMTASCLAGHHASIRHDMHVILDTAAPYIFLPFFVMTGAALKLDQVADAIPLMSLYVLLRYLCIFVACYLGGRFLLRLPPQQYKNLWLTMTPQAGVALGLANEVTSLSSDPWAAEFSATIIAAVVVNQIIGPVLCAIGLTHAGESQNSRAAKAAADAAAAAAAAAAGTEDPEAGGAGLKKPLERVNSLTGRDPRPLLPFYRVKEAVVLGDDVTAFEVALELSLYGAHVNVPLLDAELADKWQKINETILARTAKGDLIKFRNQLNDRQPAPNSDELQGLSARTDVVIFTGEPSRTLEHVRTMQATLGGRTRCPRFIAIIPDCTFAQALRDLGVLIIQPSIAMANIATRMALLDLDLATQLSTEISTTSDFSTAAYFLRHDADDDKASVHSLSELRLQGRRIALGRSVVNHHNVHYEKVADALAAANLPLPPPPPRVSMFGTTAPGHDPFAKRPDGLSAYEYYVVDDADLVPDDDDAPLGVFDEQYLSDGGGGHPGGPLRRTRSQRSSTRSRSRSRSARRSRSNSFSAYHPVPPQRRNSTK